MTQSHVLTLVIIYLEIKRKKKKRKKGEKTKTRASKIYEDEYESHQIWGKG